MRVACKGVDRGPVDDDLAALGLARQAVATEGGFATALALVRNAALIASVPERTPAVCGRGCTAVRCR